MSEFIVLFLAALVIVSDVSDQANDNLKQGVSVFSLGVCGHLRESFLAACV